MSSVQLSYLAIGAPLLVWSLTSLATVSSTRHATRVLKPRGVWMHRTSQSHFAIVSSLLHVALVSFAALLVAQIGL